jgi:hypothetical protein
MKQKFMARVFWVLFFVFVSGSLFEKTQAAEPDCSSYPGAFSSGSGTQADPYLITTLANLQCINKDTTTLSAHYRLANDIDATETNTWNSGDGFDPIGNLSTPFRGSFDGDGYSINNLFIDRSSERNVGLFGDFAGNYGADEYFIKDLSLESVSINGGEFSGGVSGNFGGNVDVVERVYVTGSVSGTSKAGGISGSNYTDIKNSYTDVSVYGSYKSGGITAENRGGVIENVYVNGDITAGSSSRAGALVAYNQGGTFTGTFFNTDNTSASECATNSDTANFGGCDGEEITGKTDAEMQDIATFTDTTTQGLTTAWDFENDPNDDTGSVDIWTLQDVTYPTLTFNEVFSGPNPAPDCSSYPGAFSSGSGTQADPYLIDTLADLQCVDKDTTTLSAHYRLANDIDASETNTWNNGDGFDPIGDATTPFSGSFDGFGHHISNLFIDRGSEARVGLFGQIETSFFVDNIGLEDVDITGGDYTGGFVGRLGGGGPFVNIYVSGVVSGGLGIAKVGALAGSSFGEINNVYSDALVNGEYKGGGLIADMLGGNLENAYFNGNVTAGSLDRAGAIVAKFSGGSIDGVFFNTDTTSASACATNSDTANFGGCDGEEITGKTDAEMQDIATFTDTTTQGLTTAWDFLSNPNDDGGLLDYWKLEAGDTYPVLSVFSGLGGGEPESNPDCSGYPAMYSGSGAPTDPYHIETLTDLQCMSSDLSGYYILQNDIDATETLWWNKTRDWGYGTGFTPVGTFENTFGGGLDGNGYVIRNLFIYDKLNTRKGVGLFGYTGNGFLYIRNLGLENVNITGGEYVGAFVGNAGTNLPATIENVYVTGQVKANLGSAYVGGLFGRTFVDVKNCYSQTYVRGGYKGGGIAGVFVGEGSLDSCYVNAEIDAYSSSDLQKSRIGVITSFLQSGAIDNTFYNSDALGAITTPCAVSEEGEFGGCDGEEITGKTDAEMQDIATFTDTTTQGLTTAWDFVDDPNDDTREGNHWDIESSYPFLTAFSGELDYDGDGVSFRLDCNDRDSTVFEDIPFYIDTDGDGFGDNDADPEMYCGYFYAPDGYEDNNDDCESDNDDVYPRTFYGDTDEDGFGEASDMSMMCVDSETIPEGYSRLGNDCEDNDNSIYPIYYYFDSDQDGYGDYFSEIFRCNESPPEDYITQMGDGDDSDPEIHPGVEATITVDTSTIIQSTVNKIGANLSMLAGGTNFAINNLVRGSGFEPAMIRQLERVSDSGTENGYPWFNFEWPNDGKVDEWDTRANGFGNGATVRFYRLVDTLGDPITFSEQENLDLREYTPDPDRVVFLGEAHVLESGGDFPDGGWIAEEGEGGIQRVYVDDSGLSLQYGDYAFISMERTYVEQDVMHSRLIPYRDANHPHMNLFQGDAEGRIVEHSGGLPQSFEQEDPGDSYLRVTANAQEQIRFGQYIYHKYVSDSQSSWYNEGQWYSQLTPGAPYRVEVWMKQDSVGGGGQVRFGFASNNGTTNYESVTQITPWEVTNEWEKYTYDFIAPEYPDTMGNIAHYLEFTGEGVLSLDNFVIYQNDAKHNFEPFGPHENSLDPLLEAFGDGPKPTLRFHSTTYGNDDKIERLLSNYGSSTFDINTGDMDGFHGATIAQAMRWSYETGSTPQTRVIPWINFSEEYTEYEIEALVEYLGVPYDPGVDTSETKPFAYMRYKQRDENGTPWTDEFREIILEYGNETWHNGSFGGWHGFGEPGVIKSGGLEYGLFAKYMFETIVASQSYWSDNNLGEKIKFAVGGSYDTENFENSYGELAAQQTPLISYVAHANYVGPKWETGDSAQEEFSAHGLQENIMGLVTNNTVGDMLEGFADARDALGNTFDLLIYEGGPGGYSPGVTDQVTENYGKSLAMGVASLDTWLFSSQKGFLHQNFWRYKSGTGWSSHTIPEEGGFQPHTGWLALEMRNRYAEGDSMVASSLDTTPTYLRNGELLPLVNSYALYDDDTGNVSVFVLSRKIPGRHSQTDFGDGYTPVTLNLPFSQTPEWITLHKLSAPDGSPIDPSANNRNDQQIDVVRKVISPYYYDAEFSVDEYTGGTQNGMPPGTVYMYTFGFDERNLSYPPLQPRNLQGISGDSQVTLSFEEPIDDGNDSISDYKVEYKSSSENSWQEFNDGISSNKQIIVTGLTNETPYNFRVQAINSEGEGDFSSEVLATPQGSDTDQEGGESSASEIPNTENEERDEDEDYDENRYEDEDENRENDEDEEENENEEEEEGEEEDEDDKNKDTSKKDTFTPVSLRNITAYANYPKRENFLEDFDRDRFSDDERKLFEMILATEEKEDMFIPFIQFIHREGDGLVVSGEGRPSSEIVLLFHSEEQYIVLIESDAQGNWEYRHNLRNKALSPGEHFAYALTYNAENKERSLITKKGFFLEEESEEVVSPIEEFLLQEKERNTVKWKNGIFMGMIFLVIGGGLFIRRIRNKRRTVSVKEG